MAPKSAAEIWEQIVQILDEKLQYGFLEQVRSVVDVRLEGSELKLSVSSDEALLFFQSHINQQRLFIMSRPVIALDKVTVERREANPLPE